MFPVVEVLVLVAALECFAVLSWWLVTKPNLAAALILIAFFFSAVTRLPSISVVTNVFLEDGIFLSILAATGFRVITRSRINLPYTLMTLLYVTFFWSFIRGVQEFGVSAAGVDARMYFYFLTAALYFSTFTLHERQLLTLARIWLYAAAGLIALCLFYWMAMLAGFGNLSYWGPLSQEAGSSSLRVLAASHTLVIATATLISLQMHVSGVGPNWQKRLCYVSLPTLLLLQHRSVWVATVLGIGWLLLSSGRVRARFAPQLALLGALASVVYLVTADGTSQELSSSLGASATNYETFEWRVEGWKQLLSSERGLTLVDRLLGQPFGAGYTRIISGYTVDASPHNFYVQTLLRLGLIGLAVMGVLYVAAFPKKTGSDRSSPFGDQLWQALLLTHLVYFIPYAPGYEQGIVLGVALGLANQRHTRLATASRGLQRKNTWSTSESLFS